MTIQELGNKREKDRFDRTIKFKFLVQKVKSEEKKNEDSYYTWPES